MANDQAKNAPPQEHPYPPTMTPYPQPFGSAYPPGYPIYYAQPPDASHGDGTNGAPPGPPYMIPFPAAPGMVYPYPPPPGQGFPQYPQPAPAAGNGMRPKRKQVKMACTNCASACKRCDEARPCERCVKYGIQHTCVDGIRKERQKGIKRGPYKRKNKTASADGGGQLPFYSWKPSYASRPPLGSPPPPVSAIQHYPAPEGYYPFFYPPPGFIPPGHDGQPAPEGTPNGAGQHPMVPYYHLPPPGFFPHFAPPGAYAPPSNGGAVSTIDPAEASRSTSQPAEGEVQPQTTAPAPSKKRTRSGKHGGQSKSKKAKHAPATTDNSASGGPVGGTDQTSEPGVNTIVEVDDG
ncbi:hypothetical protein F5I97DRAFT_1936630 [Phlebopus sp. FC_14]|nr:hypothetical protein F5I97DRAFT_1936630 [Phlebopus sp. FC_14]